MLEEGTETNTSEDDSVAYQFKEEEVKTVAPATKKNAAKQQPPPHHDESERLKDEGASDNVEAAGKNNYAKQRPNLTQQHNESEQLKDGSASKTNEAATKNHDEPCDLPEHLKEELACKAGASQQTAKNEINRNFAASIFLLVLAVAVLVAGGGLVALNSVEQPRIEIPTIAQVQQAVASQTHQASSTALEWWTDLSPADPQDAQSFSATNRAHTAVQDGLELVQHYTKPNDATDASKDGQVARRSSIFERITRALRRRRSTDHKSKHMLVV